MSRSCRCHQSLCTMGTQRESPPDTSISPQHPNTGGIPRAHAEHSVDRKFGFSRKINFGHLKTSMANHHVPHLCEQDQIENAFDFDTLSACREDYSSLHTPDSGLQATQVFSILTCRDGLCRGPLRPGSPMMALGAAQTPPKPSKGSQPCGTPHKHPPDNLDMGNKILQHLCGHLSPATF